ncbi:MAG: WbqC family protein [Candidatus Velthaea sp.]
MIVSINQPGYLPWLGYFHRIAVSDLHIVLDRVQFEKNSFTNRNRVRTRDGPVWLTVPVRTKSRFGDLVIDQVEIVGTQPWAAKHYQTLLHGYRKTAHFHAHEDFFADVYRRAWTHLAELNAYTTQYVLDALHIGTPLRSSGTLPLRGRKSELVLELCREVGATTYLSGPFGRDYLDEPAFAAVGIEVRYHDYAHPAYPQAFPGDFIPNMSAVDLLFNAGPASRDILMSGAPPVARP